MMFYQAWRLSEDNFQLEKNWCGHMNEIQLCHFAENGKKLISWSLIKQRYTSLNDPSQYIPKALGLSWNTEMKVSYIMLVQFT